MHRIQHETMHFWEIVFFFSVGCSIHHAYKTELEGFAVQQGFFKLKLIDVPLHSTEENISESMLQLKFIKTEKYSKWKILISTNFI